LGSCAAAPTSSNSATSGGARSAKKKARSGKKPGPPVHDDLVPRDFSADASNELWLGDITEHRTKEGKLYLCAMKDVFSNRTVGYSIDDRIKSRIAVNALNNAVARRGPVAGCILRSLQQAGVATID
jgi:transposase InsO family protein